MVKNADGIYTSILYSHKTWRNARICDWYSSNNFFGVFQYIIHIYSSGGCDLSFCPDRLGDVTECQQYYQNPLYDRFEDRILAVAKLHQVRRTFVNQKRRRIINALWSVNTLMGCPKMNTRNLSLANTMDNNSNSAIE